VLVARDAGVEPADARIIASSGARPHIVKVKYVRSRVGAWIDRTRIIKALPRDRFTA